MKKYSLKPDDVLVLDENNHFFDTLPISPMAYEGLRPAQYGQQGIAVYSNSLTQHDVGVDNNNFRLVITVIPSEVANTAFI